MGDIKFSLLHPSRQRPDKSNSVITKWIRCAGISNIEVIVSIDNNDPYKQRYIDLYGNSPVKLMANDNRSAIDAINNAARTASGEIFIVVSDDTDCPDDWAIILLRAIAGNKDFILKVWDGVQKWIITMPVMDREYYNRYGYVYYPDYAHQFCDTELTHVADVTNRIIWRNDIEFTHLHYSKIKEQKDSLYARNDNTWNEGKKLYLTRYRNCFGLTGVNCSNVSNDGHKQWLRAATT